MEPYQLEERLNMKAWGWWSKDDTSNHLKHKPQGWVWHIKFINHWAKERPLPDITEWYALILDRTINNCLTPDLLHVVKQLYVKRARVSDIATQLRCRPDMIYTLKRDALHRIHAALPYELEKEEGIAA